MENITLPNPNPASVEEARDAAVVAANEKIETPVVISWCDDGSGMFAPEIPGGDPESRWRDYGRSNGGQCEVEVAGRYHFVIGDASGFTEPELHLYNVKDRQGYEYLCLNESCTEADRRRLGMPYPAGGGIGG